jgi:hypothetical protein
LDPLALDDEDPGNYPPDPNDILIKVFFIAEFDDQEATIYSGLGELDPPCQVFADGFESGSTSAWSNTVP